MNEREYFRHWLLCAIVEDMKRARVLKWEGQAQLSKVEVQLARMHCRMMRSVR